MTTMPFHATQRVAVVSNWPESRQSTPVFLNDGLVPLGPQNVSPGSIEGDRTGDPTVPIDAQPMPRAGKVAS